MLHCIFTPRARVAAFCAWLVFGLPLAGCSEPQSAPDGGAAAVAVDGEQVYNRYCFSCHAAGIAGAPKVGVAEAWQPRAAQGLPMLLARTKEGIAPGMPAMGLCNNCSDAELTAAIGHMLDASGVSVPVDN